MKWPNAWAFPNRLSPSRKPLPTLARPYAKKSRRVLGSPPVNLSCKLRFLLTPLPQPAFSSAQLEAKLPNWLNYAAAGRGPARSLRGDIYSGRSTDQPFATRITLAIVASPLRQGVDCVFQWLGQRTGHPRPLSAKGLRPGLHPQSQPAKGDRLHGAARPFNA